MSGKKSRNKGAAGERELLALLQERLGVELVRNLEQVRGGGADCLSIPGYAIEVKRREVLSVDAWWKDACEKARRTGHGVLPVLAYRKSRQPWAFMLPLLKMDPTWKYRQTVDIDTFCFIVRESIPLPRRGAGEGARSHGTLTLVRHQGSSQD